MINLSQQHSVMLKSNLSLKGQEKKMDSTFPAALAGCQWLNPKMVAKPWTVFPLQSPWPAPSLPRWRWPSKDCWSSGSGALSKTLDSHQWTQNMSWGKLTVATVTVGLCLHTEKKPWWQLILVWWASHWTCLLQTYRIIHMCCFIPLCDMC